MSADNQEKALLDLRPVVHSWTELLEDYQPFTPALLYWGTGLDRDIISDYAIRYSLTQSECPKIGISPKPMFDMDVPVFDLIINCGAGGEKVRRMDLSRTLYFCPKQIWEWKKNGEEIGLRDYLQKQGFGERGKSYSVSVECAPMPLLDYAGYYVSHKPPTAISISAFGLYSTEGCSLWRWEPLLSSDTEQEKIKKLFHRPKALKASPFEVVLADGNMFWQSR